MKRLLIILTVLLICIPVVAQGDGGSTSPVVPQSSYDGVITALLAVIGFLSSLVAYLGYKTSNLVPPELVGLSLKLADLTPTKTDDEKLIRFWVNQGYKAEKINGVWIVTPPATATFGGTTTTTTTIGGVSPDVTTVPK